VSHRLDEILGLASRVSVLRDGTFQGTHPAAGMDRGHLIRLIVGEESTGRVLAYQRAATARKTPALRQNGFAFRGVRATRLDGIDVTVSAGEILGIAGLTGSGREELAAVVAGAVPAELSVTTPDGRTVTGMTPHKAKRLGIALVLANRHPAAAVRQFTVRENVSMPVLSRFSTATRINRSAETSQVLHAIRTVDLRPQDPERAYELLSGGNKQKTILAKWLSTEPRLLVLDDPTSGVDIGARHAIYDLVRQRAAAGAAVLIASSDSEDLVGVCDRVLTLVGGQVTGELVGSQITEEAVLDAILRGADAALGAAPAEGDR
jgi:ribose transport system ATP-binding protein